MVTFLGAGGSIGSDLARVPASGKRPARLLGRRPDAILATATSLRNGGHGNRSRR
jgi:hypothetical protein